MHPAASAQLGPACAALIYAMAHAMIGRLAFVEPMFRKQHREELAGQGDL